MTATTTSVETTTKLDRPRLFVGSISVLAALAMYAYGAFIWLHSEYASKSSELWSQSVKLVQQQSTWLIIIVAVVVISTQLKVTLNAGIASNFCKFAVGAFAIALVPLAFACYDEMLIESPQQPMALTVVAFALYSLTVSMFSGGLGFLVFSSKTIKVTIIEPPVTEPVDKTDETDGTDTL